MAFMKFIELFLWKTSVFNNTSQRITTYAF